MVSDDSKCLCDIFNNADMLKNLNITQDDALRLPKACGANADVSVCKKDPTSPTGSPGKPNKSSAVSDSSKDMSNITCVHLDYVNEMKYFKMLISVNTRFTLYFPNNRRMYKIHDKGYEHNGKSTVFL
ncbi:Bifunctional inhibitor/plant lipid transfer protein/seed storage helical domain containing protein [Trema orientale]|uniref:Bifunctional inhibitor/plant lipid transfer protein/seed storage helical domain containing protein n=1 Tax=Trema orientale TaxID=63057 RepID=A0A2P5AKF1_TREOI|nr:Bifunctional inhibitor/plant lipid transfer protein/seed storage helical domain containing protein [Trema orientale]